MNSIFIKIPKWIQHTFKNQVWSIPTKQKEIYLTFDDGPTPEITEWVLHQLELYNAKATFFCIGKNIVQNPGIFKKIISKGHSIGNHTHNHLQGWKTKNDDYSANISLTEEVLKNYNLPNRSKLFRPPYGKIKPSQAKRLLAKGYSIIMWEVLSADFDKKITKEKCFQNVQKNTTNGSVIVFHDSLKASEKLKFVLPKTLEYYSRKGYLFKAIV